MRLWSKSVFGRDHRLAVAVLARIAGREELYAQAIANHLGLHQAEVAQHLQDFVAAGLLEPSGMTASPSPKGGRPAVIYRRTDDDFWRCIDALGSRFQCS